MRRKSCRVYRTKQHSTKMICENRQERVRGSQRRKKNDTPKLEELVHTFQNASLVDQCKLSTNEGEGDGGEFISPRVFAADPVPTFVSR